MTHASFWLGVVVGCALTSGVFQLGVFVARRRQSHFDSFIARHEIRESSEERRGQP